MKKKFAFVVCTILLVSPISAIACSMYKVTQDGKTVVGNNEDFTTPNAQFIFEKSIGENNGVMYMSFLNEFIQGAVNDKGLMFDGFYEPLLEVKNTKGKEDIYIGDALQLVMKTMSTCEEAKEYLETINLSVLESGQIVFVDRSGTFLIIEGDVMILGDDPQKSFSNFYYSQTENLDDVDIGFYQKGRQFLNSSEPTSSLDYCSEVMQNFSQSGIASTQYSTLYDLEMNKIRIHLFQDYGNYIELDLAAELKKGNRKIMIPELFPPESIGHSYYSKYNNVEHPTILLEELLEEHDGNEKDLFENGIHNIIIDLGEEWIYDIKNPVGAINVFNYGIELMPSNSDLHYYLGKSYAENKEWENAIMYYKLALVMNPNDPDAGRRIKEAEKMMGNNK